MILSHLPPNKQIHEVHDCETSYRKTAVARDPECGAPYLNPTKSPLFSPSDFLTRY